jgi:cGMP-dependent protein kinase
MKFVDIFDECHYNKGEYIIRQYAKGNTFYIISKGHVKVTKSNSKWESPTLIKTLTRGEFFGEDALTK